MLLLIGPLAEIEPAEHIKSKFRVLWPLKDECSLTYTALINIYLSNFFWRPHIIHKLFSRACDYTCLYEASHNLASSYILLYY
jgi:hypothetical protein